MVLLLYSMAKKADPTAIKIIGIHWTAPNPNETDTKPTFDEMLL